MNLNYRISAFAIASLGALALSACQGPASSGGQDFISDDPNAGNGDDFDEQGGDTGAGESGGDPGDGGDGDGDGGDGDVAVSEADIIQLEGDLLYALSTYSGLTVVDMSNPDDLVALGTWETDAEPFEMYVDEGQAFIMFNHWGSWEWDDGLDEWNYNTSSRLVAVDATNPEAIEVKGEFTLPGRIQDSRRVGDVLYLVTMQDGYCWDCDAEQKTVVTSLDISDEAHPVVVEQLEFVAEDNNWDWQRSVESTTDRMYIASRTWEWEGLGSQIDVVDISAHDGSLVPGDQVVVAGSVFSRWQMDEFEGVLRVISQLDWNDDPLIETFTIEDSQSFVALGTGNLSLPEPESLRSARFDGDRAYAITAEQTDPLFTIDLSDPANPVQVGELEIPGWVYHMETRDDRILALGFDPAHPDGSVNVSLFDVSEFDTPTLLRRVHFGGNWASFAEDQNRIHKAFSILDDEQMLLVPHAGWDYDEENESYECGGSYRGGVQIIDWKDDDLTLRGLVPSRGRPRRAFTHRERIVTVSDVELATFDYADRDAPTTRDDLKLAVHVDSLVHAGGVWVRLGRNWSTNEQILEVVDADDPAAPEPLGEIDLGETEPCEWASVEDLYAVDDHVFVVQAVNKENWDDFDNNYESFTRIISVDVSDPSNPVIDDEFELDGERSWGTGNLAGVNTDSSWQAQHGDKLVFFLRDTESNTHSVQVVDLSDPSQLELEATLERPAGQTQGQLSVLSDTVVSWHTEPVEGQPGKVRFYFDRLDLDGAPQWAEKVNVPGIIVAWDGVSRAYTVDFQITEVDLDPDACWNHPKVWTFDWDQNGMTGTCKLIERELKQLDVAGSGATLVDTLDIEGETGLQQLRATASRIFAKTGQSWWEQEADDSEGIYHNESELVIVDIASVNAELHSLDGEQFGRWWTLMAAEAERAVLRTEYGEIGLVDATNPAQPNVLESSLPGYGGCYNPVIDGDTVYCPMGAYGLEVVQW